MELTESQIKNIVGQVMAKMQLGNTVTGMHGVFTDMNTAIEKAKEAQKHVRVMSMDQRERIIARIRTKIKENADLTGDTDIIVRTLSQPTCMSVNILEGNEISFDIIHR